MNHTQTWGNRKLGDNTPLLKHFETHVQKLLLFISTYEIQGNCFSLTSAFYYMQLQLTYISSKNSSALKLWIRFGEIYIYHIWGKRSRNDFFPFHIRNSPRLFCLVDLHFQQKCKWIEVMNQILGRNINITIPCSTISLMSAWSKEGQSRTGPGRAGPEAWRRFSNRFVYLEHRRFAMNKQRRGFFETI